MIHEDLYKDDLTENNYGEIFTPSFTSMSGGYFAQYAIGYVLDENCPHQLRPTKAHNAYAPENVGNTTWETIQAAAYDVFIVGNNSGTSTYPQFHNQLSALVNYTGNEKSVLGIGSTIPQLLNRYKPKNTSIPYEVSIRVHFTGRVSATTYIGYGSALSAETPANFTLRIDDFIDTMNGNSSVNTTFEHLGKTYSLYDFVNNRYIFRDDGDDMIGFYYLSYEISGYTRPVTDDGANSSYDNSQPAIGYPLSQEVSGERGAITGYITFGSCPVTGIKNYSSTWLPAMRIKPQSETRLPRPDSNNVNVRQLGYYQQGEGVSYQFDEYVAGDFAGILTRELIMGSRANQLMYKPSAEILRQYYSSIGDNQESLVIYGTSDIGAVASVVSLADIFKHMALFPIWKGKNATESLPQENENWWYSVIINNEFTGRIIQGNSPEFEKSVPPWVKQNNTDGNDYNPNTDRPSGGDDSQKDPDSDKEVSPNKVEGVNMPLQLNRTLGSGLGFITMYNITPEQLQTLGRVLWSSCADYAYSEVDPETGAIVQNFFIQLGEEVTGTFDTSAILNYFISLRQFPFSVGTLPISQNFGSEIFIGNGKVGIPISSGVRVLSSSIGYLQAGSCNIKPVTPYNDFRDYYNTTVTLYLPYCGTVELNPAEVINQTLSCYYTIDFYSGECTAFICVDTTPSYIIAVSSGIIGFDIPLSASAEAQLQGRHIIDGANNMMAVFSGVNGLIDLAGGIASENPMLLYKGVESLATSGANAMRLDAERRMRSGVSAPFMSGGAGASSLYAPDSVYAIIRRGTYKRPSNYPHTVAYPTTRSGKLSSFSGYTICINPDVTGIGCTEDERVMIKSFLSSGVIV